MYANQVDVMQACVIALETYQAFRHTIPGKDLMPQVMVEKDDSFFYAPIIELYEAVLRPYFEGALSKHSLTSSVALDITSTPLDESPTFSDVEIQIIIKAMPDEKFDVRPSSEQTSLGKTLFDKFRNKVVFDTKQHFKIANYDRR